MRLRVDIWANPWLYANGSGYQIVQALYAYATGGVLGTGFGYGSPGWVPAVHTDFVFAAIGEELGLAGTLATLVSSTCCWSSAASISPCAPATAFTSCWRSA